MPVILRSKEWACSRSLAGIAGSNSVRGMNVSCKSYVFSSGGICDGPISRPEESYRMCCLSVISKPQQ
jgi:hypothetical protein